MTKIGPHCKSGNADINTFCYSCGKDIINIKPTSKKYKPPKNVKSKRNFISRWWNKQSQNNKYGYGLLTILISLFLVWGVVIVAVSLMEKPAVTKTVTDNPSTTTETTPTVNNTSPGQSEEDKYRQWVKDDYKRWENAMGSSSQLYQLYQAAKSVTPPEKYKEFHQHYIKSYYYYYMAQKAAENNNPDDVGYYTDLALKEDDQLGVYMPDYAQLTAS